MNIQTELKTIRKNKKISQKSIAEQLGVRQQMVSKIENEQGVTMGVLASYAYLLGYRLSVEPIVSKYFENSGC